MDNYGPATPIFSRNFACVRLEIPSKSQGNRVVLSLTNRPFSPLLDRMQAKEVSFETLTTLELQENASMVMQASAQAAQEAVLDKMYSTKVRNTDRQRDLWWRASGEAPHVPLVAGSPVQLPVRVPSRLHAPPRLHAFPRR